MRPAGPLPPWLRALGASPLAVVGALSLVALLRPTPFPDDGAPVAAEAPQETDEAAGQRRKRKPDDADAKPGASADAKKPDDDGKPEVTFDVGKAIAAQQALEQKLRIRDLKGAVAALQHLLEIRPDAAKDHATRRLIVELAVQIMFVSGSEPDTVFSMIATQMGPTGIDILYELATTKGGSRAAKYAETLLDDPRVLQERGSEAVQIAWLLRRTTDCELKKQLFPRAGKVGDARTLGQLHLMTDSCKGRKRAPNTCCYTKEPQLEAALAALKARGIR